MWKKADKGLKALYFILLVCVLILVYFGCVGLIFFRKVETPIHFYTNTTYWRAYNELYKEYDTNLAPLSKQEYRSIIEDQRDLNFYFYDEKVLNGEYNGYAFATIRLILVDERVTGFDYAVVFTHEVMHIKEMVGNERWVNFETFKYLYESDIAELHNAGVLFGLKQLEFRYSSEYQCEDMIIKYLEDN